MFTGTTLVVKFSKEKVGRTAGHLLLTNTTTISVSSGSFSSTACCGSVGHSQRCRVSPVWDTSFNANDYADVDGYAINGDALSGWYAVHADTGAEPRSCFLQGFFQCRAGIQYTPRSIA